MLKNKEKIGQTLVEMTIVIGIVTTALVAMTPMMKRALQGMIKVAADQVGYQDKSDQDFSDGFLVNSMITVLNPLSEKRIIEDNGVVSYWQSETVITNTVSVMNYGVQEAQ